MDATRFDTVAKRFAHCRLSRRAAMRQGGASLAVAGLAAGGLAGTAHAQEATPAPADATGEKVAFLFVQSFQSGTIAPKAGEDGTFTLTLEQGLGQTIYFSDRPDRIVGTTPTPQFLEGLGFPDDNPPNAALVVARADGQTDVAVVELFNPGYDAASHTATYDVKVLADWEESLALGFGEAPSDPAALAPSFGAAHLFIDDCPDLRISCTGDTLPPTDWGSAPTCWNYGSCIPCEPFGHTQPDICATFYYWGAKCNESFSGCKGTCRASNGQFWGVTCG